MDIQRFIKEYEGGRRIAKEYPNFGMKILFSPRRRRVKRKFLTCKERSENITFHPKQRNQMRSKQLTQRTRRKKLHFCTVSAKEGAAIQEAMLYIHGGEVTKQQHRLGDSIMKNVLVRRQAGETICLTLAVCKTIKDVKEEIEQRIGTPCKVQRLRHKGRPVKDYRVIGDLGQGQNDLDLLLFESQLLGGAPPVTEETKGNDNDEKQQRLEALQAFLAAYDISLDDVESLAKQRAAASPAKSAENQSAKPGTSQDKLFADGPVEATTVSTTAVVKEGQPPWVNEETDSDYLEKQLPYISFNDEANATTSDKTFCLRYMFGRKGSRANDLEKKFKFLILYDTDKTNLSDKERRVIWKDVIQKHTHDWIQLLSPNERQGWQMCSDDNTVFINGEPMELRFATANKSSESMVKALPFDTFSKSDDSKVILLVDESIMASKVQGRFCTSRDGSGTIVFRGKTDSPFHACISFNGDDVNTAWGDFMEKNTMDKAFVSDQTVKTCNPRKFKSNAIESSPYQEGSQLDCQESGDEGDLLTACHEFKLFTFAVETGYFIEKFCTEVIRFACACLNSRKNGTIHFGIADENNFMSERSKMKPRQIIGVPVPNKIHYKDKLTDYKNKYFHKDTRDFARKCIGNPEFILVETEAASSETRYVIEVDIEPSFEFTREQSFSVTLPSGLGAKPNKIGKYITRNGAQSCELTSVPPREVITRLDRKRNQEELTLGTTTCQNMAGKLRTVLWENCGKLDPTFKRILVLSSMDKSILTPDFCERAAVLTNIPWSYVIDFNHETKNENGLCQSLTKNSDFSIHDAEEFNSAKFRRDQIPEAWVFANGMGDRNPPLPWEDWQTSERANGLEELLKKSKDEFPVNRTLVLFVIKPGFSKTDAIMYGNFLRHFGKNAVSFYIEDQETETKWSDYIVKEYQYYKESKYLSCAITKLPFEEFCEEIKNLTAECKKGTIHIPLNQNALCAIERGHFKDKSVQIMDAKECDYLQDMSEKDRKSFERKKREDEQRFYSGQSEVSMENLWFTEAGANHVIERDVMRKLATCFEYALSSEPGQFETTRIIRFKYSRGSGGTTVAKHFLWKLFHCDPPYKARCCVLGKSIVPETSDTIYKLWNFRNDNRLPIFVLVDDHQSSNFEMLVKGVADKIENGGVYTKGVAVVFLSVEASSQPLDDVQRNSEDRGLCISMGYTLNKREYTRFQEKYQNMQERYGGPNFKEFAEKTLPSFIMMMQRSREERRSYAKRFVESTLPDVSENEHEMLMYLSLICTNVPDSPHVYIASFDPIMTSINFRRERYHSSWTTYLGENAEVFLRYQDLAVSEDAFWGPEPGVTIVFKEFAEEILAWAERHEGKDIGDVALDFMNSPAFPSSDEIPIINEYIRCLYYNMYLALQRKTRIVDPNGKKEMFNKFSDLIRNILRKERRPSKSHLDKALQVMQLGFKKMDRPVLAQQVARLAYIHGSSIRHEQEQYFSMAEEWINKALSKRRDSYFLDTAGRIQVCKLQVTFPLNSYDDGQSKDCIKALEICLESIKWFQDSQKSEQFRKVLNTAGYFGEMQVMHYFMALLGRFNIFQSDDDLRKYVCTRKWRPVYALPWTNRHENRLRTFRSRYINCLSKVEEIHTILKMENEMDILVFEDRFKDFFVYISEEDTTDNLVKWRQNWMFIQRQIGGGIFRNVFNRDRIKGKSSQAERDSAVEALKSIRQKLQENLLLDISQEASANISREVSKEKDVLLLIIVKMALYSPFRCPQLPRSAAVSEYLETKENMESLLQKEERLNGEYKRYCLLFSLMFHWPHNRTDIPINAKWEQRYQNTLKKLDEMSTALQQTYQKPDQDTGEEFCRRQKLKHDPKYSSVTTLFYLGQGNGLDMYVHINELPTDSSRGHRINWAHADIQRRLERLTGSRVSKKTIEMTTLDGKVLPITVSLPCQDKFSLEEVSFYVGFSWKGPLAYAVTPK